MRLLLCLLLAGCGFLEEEPFSGRRVEGVAPWRDLGPVTFCDGSVRVAPPSVRAGGLCAPAAAAPAAACARDEECGSRERCTCGGCQVALCASASDCSGEFVCTFSEQRCDRPCSGDGDCAAGETCLPGQGACRGACAGDGDCQRGERCDAGRCAVVPCTGDGACGAGRACALQRAPGDLREPHVASDGETVLAWVERRDGAGEASVWRATSPDGVRFRFDPPAAVLAPGEGDGGRAGAPSLLRRPDGGWLAVWADGNGRLRRATSPDGVTFAVDAAPLLAPRPEIAWEAAGLDAPALADGPAGSATAGRVLLYYGTTDRAALGLAESSDGGLTFAAAAEPLLTPAAAGDPLLWRDLDRVASPFVEPAVDAAGAPFLRVYFAARGRESGGSLQLGTPIVEPANFSIGAATSFDGRRLVPWPFPPVFGRVQGFLGHPSESEPAVGRVGGRRLLYYRAAAADEGRPTNLGAAENPPAIPGQVTAE